MAEFDGRTVLLTGDAGGIGLATVVTELDADDRVLAVPTDFPDLTGKRRRAR